MEVIKRKKAYRRSKTSAADIPEEIWDHILKYVGSNPKDLLPCRLVNRKWHKRVTGLLKKKGICVTVDLGNIRLYRELLEKCKMERPSLPATTAPLDRLNLKVKLPKDSCSGYCDALPLITGVTNLVEGKDDKFEVERIVDPNNVIFEETFYKLLHGISSTLKSLYLKPSSRQPFEFFESESEDSEEESNERAEEAYLYLMEEKDLVKTMSFPKLQCIQYDVHNLAKVGPTPARMIKIIESAPSMQSIIIPAVDVGEEDEELWQAQYRKQMYVSRILDGLVKPNNEIPLGLSTLDIPIYNDESLRSLCQLKLPKLQSLKLHQKVICMLSASFYSFLANNVPSLDSLELYFLQFSSPPEDLAQFDPSSFGQITQITHFGLYTHFPDDSTFSETPEFYKSSLITSAVILAFHFPSCTAIDTDITALALFAIALKDKNTRPIAASLPSYLQRFYSSMLFPKVTKLCVNFDFSYALCWLFGDEDVDEETENITTHLELMCPALSSLTLNIEDERRSGMDHWIVVSGLQAILRIHGVQSLEINNYFDWIPYLIDKWVEDETLNNLRQNLKHLKFGYTPKTTKFLKNPAGGVNDVGTGSVRRSDRRIIANIEYDDFLKLQSVQIQEKILRTDKDGKTSGFKTALDILNALRSRPFYPRKRFELYY